MRSTPHYFAVLIGCGATTVNPYLAQDTMPTGWSAACWRR
jgi:hypothetical protein